MGLLCNCLVGALPYTSWYPKRGSGGGVGMAEGYDMHAVLALGGRKYGAGNAYRVQDTYSCT